MGAAPAGLAESITAYINSLGYSVRYEDCGSAKGGQVDFETREVTINSTYDPAAQVKTLLHETCHILLGHGEEAARASKNRQVRELEAESAAYMTGQALGFETGTASFAYLANWSEAGDGKVNLEKVGSAAAEASAKILKALVPAAESLPAAA